MTVKHTFVSSDMRVFALCSLMELHRDVEKAIRLFQSYDRARKQMLAVLLKEQNVRRISA